MLLAARRRTQNLSIILALHTSMWRVHRRCWCWCCCRWCLLPAGACHCRTVFCWWCSCFALRFSSSGYSSAMMCESGNWIGCRMSKVFRIEKSSAESDTAYRDRHQRTQKFEQSHYRFVLLCSCFYLTNRTWIRWISADRSVHERRAHKSNREMCVFRNLKKKIRRKAKMNFTYALIESEWTNRYR